MAENTHEHANVVAPPPLIYAGGLLLSVLSQKVLSLPLRRSPVLRATGLLLMGLSLLLGFSAVTTMRRARTGLRRDTPVTALVTSGPFLYTRNPIYLSFSLLYIGIALFAGLLWSFLFLPVVLAVINLGVIAREEQYLTRKFGEEYIRYKAQVRRWL